MYERGAPQMQRSDTMKLHLIYSMARSESFSSIIKDKSKMSTLEICTNIVLEFLIKAVSKNNDLKGKNKTKQKTVVIGWGVKPEMIPSLWPCRPGQSDHTTVVPCVVLYSKGST